MASIKFILKSNSNPSAIYVRLIDGRKTDVMARTKYVINPSDWSVAKQQPKSLTDPDFKRLNSDLQDIKSNLLKYYNKTNGVQTIDTKWLKEFLNPSGIVDGYPTGLLAYLDFYIESKKKTVTNNSLKKYNVIKNKLIRFQKDYKSVILIKDVNESFQTEFENYCIKNNYAHNTIVMEMRFIKTICRHAQKKGIETHSQLESIENKFEKVENIFLTQDDIDKIKNAKDNGKELSESLDNVRDWLLISCYSGQRISDFLRFKKSMIRYEENRMGKTVPLIEFKQQKTGTVMTLPLHKEIIAILGKRGGEFPPVISDQKYNKYIKEVCQVAGLNEIVKGSKKTETKKDSGIFRKETGNFEKWELVSSHIGRRSFATNFYGKIPTVFLIAATGHSTEEMFLKYIGKSGSEMAKELAEYF